LIKINLKLTIFILNPVVFEITNYSHKLKFSKLNKKKNNMFILFCNKI